MNDPGTDPEALEDQYAGGDEDLDINFGNEPSCSMDQIFKINEMVNIYNVAKKAIVGTSIICTTCRQHNIKKSYQHVFCKPKKKGKSSCKDKYWNTVDDERRARAKNFR